MITELTEAQKAQIPGWVSKWTKEGLRTDEADWPRFERATRECYKYANLEPPKRFVRVQSPVVLSTAAPVADWLLGGGKASQETVLRVLTDVLGADYAPAAFEAVKEAYAGGFEAESDTEPIRNAIRQNWYRYLGGQMWVGWQAYTSFFRDVVKLGLPGDTWDRDRAYSDAQTAAFWWWPHTEFVMVCNRPRVINRNDRGNLHAADGPSIAFRDGWALYHWHGVRVPEDIILKPEGITPERIMSEQNAEVRRCMVERYGADKFIKVSGAKKIHEDQFGKLWRVDFSDGREPFAAVQVVNGTPEPDGTTREFYIPVPPEMERARQAVAWTYYMEENEYNPEFRT